MSVIFKYFFSLMLSLLVFVSKAYAEMLTLTTYSLAPYGRYVFILVSEGH
jgi:hypothetical protein